MSAATKKAKAAYREAVRIQATMPADRQWMMGEEIRLLKAAAYVEMEHDKLFGSAAR